MAALNFPTTDLEAGVTEYSANGTTYLWDGVKWVGRTAGGAAGTNSIQNNGNTVQVDAGGNLALPAFAIPNTVGTTGQVLKWPASGTTLVWSTDNNSSGATYTLPAATDSALGGVKLGEGFVLNGSNQVTTNKLYSTNESQPNQHYRLELTTGGTIKLPDQSEIIGSTLKGIYGTGEANYTGITIGPTAQNSEESWMYVDHNGAYIATQYNTDQKLWTFGNDGTLTMPLETKLNSGGIGVPNSAEVGTTVAFDGPDIVNSEVFMGSGYGEFRSIYNKTSPLESGLVYAGVEGFNYANYGDVNFAGMVSQTPNIDSMYALSLNEQGQIVIGFTQDGQTQTSNDWSVVVGTLTTDYTVNGLFANTTTTVIGSGLSSWKFDNAGVLNLPNNNGQIGQLEAPYTGLEFRTGSGADWIGISYGEINDNNTSYFYFDKDGSDYTTANHRAHLQLKNAAHDGHVEWLFDVTGNLTLPPGGDILNSSGQSVLGAGGNANTGNFTFDADTISNDNGLLLATDRGTLAFGTNMEGPGVPGHFHIAFDGSNINAPSNDLFLGDDYNYVKLPGDTITPYGVEIGAHNRDGGDTHNWRFETDGNLVLPQGSTISDQTTSVDLTVGRTSDNQLWYNLFGDTGATGNNYANTAINGSVVHDSGGNVYVLGSTIDWNNGSGSNNLFLKYSPQGNLLWRRTWTDDNGLNCGSFNASLRYIEANIDLGTQDTIVWAAQVPWDKISYIGTMDTEGNLVDQYGDARLPTRLDNFTVTDLVWTGNVDEVGDSTVGVVGQQYLPGPGYHFPAFAGVDLANAAVFSNTTIMPDGTNLNYGDPNNSPNYVNQFKAVTTIPAWNGNPAVGALVGTYYDGTYSHAMVALSSNGPPVTYGIGVDNYSEDDIIGEDICADANGNVYVIVNNISSNTAVLIKASAVTLDNEFAVWKLRLGPSSADSFYASAVAYDNGYVYVLGQYYDAGTGDTDAMIIKVGIGNGDVVWQRRIGSPGDDGVSFLGGAGWESSSGISVYDNLIAISFATEARTPGINNGPPELNTVTLQYPTDGSLTGTYGDFVISDFDIGNAVSDYNITTLTTSLGGEPVTDGFAALQATTATVGTGWTNTQWDLENNREILSSTFKFNADGTFDTAEIKHQGEVKITANTTVANAVPSTWTFQNNDGLRFPDGSVQYGAYIETEMSMDGGSAVTVFNILPRPPVADGGGSSSRFGVNDPVYDGSGGNDYVLDGGGA